MENKVGTTLLLTSGSTENTGDVGDRNESVINQDSFGLVQSLSPQCPYTEDPVPTGVTCCGLPWGTSTRYTNVTILVGPRIPPVMTKERTGHERLSEFSGDPSGLV